MAGFTENALVRKLQELNSSQQSIQTLSLWLIHHRKHHSAVVKTWFKELLKIKDGRQLTFMYLANDVIQNSKKKGPEYGQEFGKVLVESFKHMAKTGINTKTKHSLHRILNIWQERGVYDAAKIQEFKVAVDPNDAEPETKTTTKRKSIEVDTPEHEEPKKKSKNEVRESKHERRRSETKVEVDGHIEIHTTLSPKTPPGDPPEPEELVKAVLELESSASSDEAVRERIASLPPEVSEVSLLSKLAGKMPPAYHINVVLKLMQRQLELRQWLIANRPPDYQGGPDFLNRPPSDDFYACGHPKPNVSGPSGQLASQSNDQGHSSQVDCQNYPSNLENDPGQSSEEQDPKPGSSKSQENEDDATS